MLRQDRGSPTIALVNAELDGVSLAEFAGNKRKRWIVERGLEIISKASRHLPDELKAWHPAIHGEKSPASAMCCATSTNA